MMNFHLVRTYLYIQQIFDWLCFQLKEIFKDLKPYTRIVSSKSFCVSRSDERLTHRHMTGERNGSFIVFSACGMFFPRFVGDHGRSRVDSGSQFCFLDLQQCSLLFAYCKSHEGKYWSLQFCWLCDIHFFHLKSSWNATFSPGRRAGSCRSAEGIPSPAKAPARVRPGILPGAEIIPSTEQVLTCSPVAFLMPAMRWKCEFSLRVIGH